MLIAVEGCAHGELDSIYEAIAEREKELDRKVDLLLCCGDFEAIRNDGDLKYVAPSKEERASGTSESRRLRDFHRYYSGEKVAPVLTVFIGGNHEASNHLQELFYGGWAAPNIYYLGQAGCIRINGIRIAGISGIYKSYDYLAGHFELPPYDTNAKISIIHYRAFHAYRLKLLAMMLHEQKDSIDVMMSHDWPDKIFGYGNVDELKRIKPNCNDQIKSGSFSSPPLTMLLHAMRPRYWFSGHMHVSYKAVVDHSTPEKMWPVSELPSSSEEPPPREEFSSELSPDAEGDLSERQRFLKRLGVAYGSSRSRNTVPKRELPRKTPAYPLIEKCDPAEHTTHFQALDKCAAGAHFLQLYEMEADVRKKVTRSTARAAPKIEYDIVWLAVLKATNEFLPLGRQPTQLMGVDISGVNMLRDGEWMLPNRGVIEKQLQKLQKSVEDKLDGVKSTMNGHLEVLPKYFSRSAPIASAGGGDASAQAVGPQPVANAQTTTLCNLLKLTDPLLAIKKNEANYNAASYNSYNSFRGRGRGALQRGSFGGGHTGKRGWGGY